MRAPIALTDTQRALLEFIRSSVQRVGLPPTRKEIKEYFGWRSANSAQACLLALEKKGRITLLGGHISRGIVVNPVIGRSAMSRFRDGDG